MTHENAIPATESARSADPAPVDVGTAEGARVALVARITEALRQSPNAPWLVLPGPTDIAPSFARAIAPLVDAEVAAAVSEARAEVERQAVLLRAINDCHDDPARAILQADKLAGGAIIRATVAEAGVERLREGIRALANEWESFGPTDVAWHWDRLGERVRALLAPSPAATTSEACA